MRDRIVVLTARPGRIKENIAIERPRPRDPLAPEVDRAFAEQENIATAA